MIYFLLKEDTQAIICAHIYDTTFTQSHYERNFRAAGKELTYVSFAYSLAFSLHKVGYSTKELHI